MNTKPTNSDPAVPEVARATRRGRLVLAIAFVLAAALMAAYQFLALPYLKGALGSAPPPNAIALIKQVILGLCIPVAGAGMYLIWYGRKITRAGRFPLPGAWVWRDTLIKRGRGAVRIARLHYLAGALIVILGAVLAAYLWIMLDRLAPPIKLPPGVTILQQRSFSPGTR